jgi:hypothetical protein
MGKTKPAKARLPVFMALRLIKAAREKAKKAAEMQPEPAPAPPPPPTKSEDLLAEIDAMFDDIKAKKKKTAPPAPEPQAPQSAKRRYTEEGLPIYTEEELQMNHPKAGTTPLCPFDCDCCH